MNGQVEHVTCEQLVEALTDYLEGVLGDDQRGEIERHIVFCRGCATYVEQMRHTVALVARLAQEPPGNGETGELLAIFRQWSAERGEGGAASDPPPEAEP
jgi:anti-sigma factor RsiW